MMIKTGSRGIEWSKMVGNGAWLNDEPPLEAVSGMGGIFRKSNIIRDTYCGTIWHILWQYLTHIVTQSDTYCDNIVSHIVTLSDTIDTHCHNMCHKLWYRPQWKSGVNLCRGKHLWTLGSSACWVWSWLRLCRSPLSDDQVNDDGDDGGYGDDDGVLPNSVLFLGVA